MSDLILNRFIFEAKYDFGYEYLDKCGLTIKEIVQNIHPFSVNIATPNSGNLVDDEENIQMNFNINKFIISQNQNVNIEELMSIDNFSNLSDKILHVILKNLNINTLNRLGFRIIYLMGFDDRELCFEYIKTLKKTENFFKQDYFNNLTESEFSLTFIEDFFKVRLKISIGEQSVVLDPNIIALSNLKTHELSRDQKKARIYKLKAKKYIKKFPKSFLLFDVDVSDEFPDDDISKINYVDFIVNSNKFAMQYIQDFLK